MQIAVKTETTFAPSKKLITACKNNNIAFLVSWRQGHSVKMETLWIKKSEQHYTTLKAEFERLGITDWDAQNQIRDAILNEHKDDIEAQVSKHLQKIHATA